MAVALDIFGWRTVSQPSSDAEVFKNSTETAVFETLLAAHTTMSVPWVC